LTSRKLFAQLKYVWLPIMPSSLAKGWRKAPFGDSILVVKVGILRMELPLQPAATRGRVPLTDVVVESIEAEHLPAYIWWRWTLEPVFSCCHGIKHPESLVVICSAIE
jgi:hypothetical protein